jgi:hypothetical protein
MAEPSEIELVFAPEDEGGYHVYAPELPGLHTHHDGLDDAITTALIDGVHLLDPPQVRLDGLLTGRLPLI